MRAIGYFRSGDDYGTLRELEGAFSDYCQLNLHQAMKAFGDAKSSRGSGRVEYQRMVEYMRESGSNFLVVVPDARHLGDDLESVARTLIELEASGAKVECADEEFPDPLQNAFKTLGVKGVSNTRSNSIRESMRARALKGQGLGRPPYGYRNGRNGGLEVVREEAPIVELIFRLHTKNGLGLRLCAQHLNERGISTRRGGNWNIVTIRDILKNPTYMGTYTRFGLRLPRAHEPIIPPDVFRAAQTVTTSRRPVGRISNSEPFLLSGLIYCDYCGNRMMGVTRRQTWKRKDGRRANGTYRYYQCQSRNNQSLCGYHTWRASRLEGSVLTQLRYVLQANAANSPDGSPTGGEKTRAALHDRVKNCERRLLHAMRRAAAARISIATLGRYLEELDSARNDANSPEERGDANGILEKWDLLDFTERQRFLTNNIVRVVVKDDTTEVVV